MSSKPQNPKLADLRPRITVIGVGGAGCNAINNMIASGLTGVDFVAANTDAQALAASSAEHRLQLGIALTEGLGAGSKPEIGEAAAEEALEDIRAQISGSHMVFIACGMGGGTGTGAASVLARTAKELGILTVGVVTKPFLFEGARRMRVAEAGVIELKKHVDTLIVIPNQNLFRIANEKTTFAEAFLLADQVLYSGVACIVDLILKEGLINLDFADVRTVMSGMGTAMMGTGEGSGERRAIEAAEEAISNPLLDDVTLRGAKGLLLSITGGPNLTLYEVDSAASRVREEVDAEANIIVGATFDPKLGDKVRVSIVASGMARLVEPADPGASGAELWPRKASRLAGGRQHAAAAAESPAHSADEDMHRRLSEALQYGLAGESYGDAAGASESPGGVQRWQAPGDVTIEESYASYGNHPSAPMPAPGYDRGPGQSGPDFRPAAPADPRRASRRMPEVGDFPVVGQRDYYAKAPATGHEAAGGGKRTGFFGRLAGFGRRASDSPEKTNDVPSRGGPLRQPESPQDGQRAPQRETAQRAQSKGPQHSEGIELPAILSRDRR